MENCRYSRAINQLIGFEHVAYEFVIVLSLSLEIVRLCRMPSY